MTPSNRALVERAAVPRIRRDGLLDHFLGDRCQAWCLRGLAVLHPAFVRRSRPSWAFRWLSGDLPCSFISSFAKPAPSLISPLTLISVFLSAVRDGDPCPSGQLAGRYFAPLCRAGCWRPRARPACSGLRKRTPTLLVASAGTAVMTAERGPGTPSATGQSRESDVTVLAAATGGSA